MRVTPFVKVVSLAAYALAAGLLASGTALATPVYMPTGAQANVALSTVTGGGWTQCYAAAMATTIGNAGENVLNVCQGDYIMMAGRATGSQTLLSLAATTRSVSVPPTPSSRPSLNLPTSCPLQRRRGRSGFGSATAGTVLGAGGGLSGIGLEGRCVGDGQRG